MSDIGEQCKTYRVIINHGDELKCEVDVNLETYKKIQAKDPATLQALWDVCKEAKPEPTQDLISETPISVLPPPSSNLSAGLWDEGAETCLLQSYCKYNSHPQKWRRIEEEMRIKQYAVSAEQCRDRWRKIAKRYQTRRKHQNAGKQDVVIPELWQRCFGIEASHSQTLDDVVHSDVKDVDTLEALLRAYRESRPDSEPMLETTTHEYTFWNVESELLLLRSYFKHSHQSQKWKKVEEELRSNGIMVSAEKCRDKWRRLEKKHLTRPRQRKPSDRQTINELWEMCFSPESSDSQLQPDIQASHEMVTDAEADNDLDDHLDDKDVDVSDDKGNPEENHADQHVAGDSTLMKVYKETKTEPASEAVTETSSSALIHEHVLRKNIYSSSFWNEDSENLLLEAYLKHCHHQQKWTKVEEELRSSGYPMSAEQCRDKWRRLERRYQTRKKNLQKSNRHGLDIPELWEKCFGLLNTKNQTPTGALQSGNKVTRKRVAATAAADEPFCGELSQEEGDNFTCKCQHRKRRRLSSVGKIIAYLKSRDQVMRRLHEEHNRLLHELVELLKSANK